MRRIEFEQIYRNSPEPANLTFCGPSTRDGTYAFVISCGNCGEETYCILSESDVEDLAACLEDARIKIAQNGL